MNFIKKYSIVIICILLLAFVGKSCQSCSRARTIEFNKIQYEQNIVELQQDIDTYKDSIVVLNERLKAANSLNSSMERHLSDINNTNSELTKTNNNLINHIKKQDENIK